MVPFVQRKLNRLLRLSEDERRLPLRVLDGSLTTQGIQKLREILTPLYLPPPVDASMLPSSLTTCDLITACEGTWRRTGCQVVSTCSPNKPCMRLPNI